MKERKGRLSCKEVCLNHIEVIRDIVGFTLQDEPLNFYGPRYLQG